MATADDILARRIAATLATLNRNHVYLGDALIRVNWSPLDTTTPGTSVTTSTIVPIFSNLRKWQDGTLDRLVHDGKIVDQIVFRTSAGADMPLTEDGGKLGISVTDAAATVTYTDGTRLAAAVASSTFMGKFVGSSGDGPLGILGTWEVPNFGNTDAAGRYDLVGSFGADLTSFETLLP